MKMDLTCHWLFWSKEKRTPEIPLDLRKKAPTQLQLQTFYAVLGQKSQFNGCRFPYSTKNRPGLNSMRTETGLAFFVKMGEAPSYDSEFKATKGAKRICFFAGTKQSQ